MTLELSGRTAIVTGAGSPAGIGFAIARHLLARGADVAVTATGERIHARAKELETEAPRVVAYQADLTNESEVQELVEAVFVRFGRIDILVNNAGMAREGRQPANGELSAISLEEWQQQIAITAGRVAHYASAEVWADRECDVGDGSAGQQRKFGGLRRSKRGYGRNDARRGHCRRAARNHDEWSGAGMDCNGVFVAGGAGGGETHATRARGYTIRGRRSRWLSCFTGRLIHGTDSGCRRREHPAGNQESLRKSKRMT